MLSFTSNSSNTDVQGWWLAQPTNPKRQYLTNWKRDSTINSLKNGTLKLPEL